MMKKMSGDESLPELIKKLWKETDGGNPQQLLEKINASGRDVTITAIYNAKHQLVLQKWQPSTSGSTKPGSKRKPRAIAQAPKGRRPTGGIAEMEQALEEFDTQIKELTDDRAALLRAINIMKKRK